MRFFDFHTHPYRPAELNPPTRDFIARISPAVREHGERLADPSYAADLLRAQGALGAVVLPEHCPATSGNVRTESVLEHCAAEPDFYLPFASVDPNTDAEPAALLERYIAAGVRGLKLYPSYQFFYLDDRRVYPLYELCQAHGLPVLFHIGSSVIPGTRIRYCDPLRLDDVAVDFPDLTLVMAHGGRGLWYRECAFLAGHHANLYIDVTGLVPDTLLELFPALERLADKVVFGSDWPAMPRSPGHNARVVAGLGLSDDAVDRILRRNAARILSVDLTGENLT
ncbi:MAG TPA: amidohydrolase family protein [Longimicrobiales bacterium]|nr:amidohydrolase family protein [Longimicrobiales bacterium]